MNRRSYAGRQALGAVLAAAILTALAGCAPQLDRIEVAIQANRDQIARLEAENKGLRQEVQALNSLLRLEMESGDETSAVRLAKLTQVSSRLDQLIRMLEDNAEYQRNLSARVDLLVTRSGLPTLGEYRPPQPGGRAVVDLPEEGRSILEMADLDRSQGNDDLARAGYEEFLARFQNTEAADEALYWLGDLDLNEGQPAAALMRFDELIRRFPEGLWASPGLFKSRACLLELGRTAEAQQRADRLLQRYPDSAEAALLKAELGLE